jgi:hypothetical protein
MASSPLRDAALYYAAAGYCVFPCRPGAKVPATQHGCRDATADADRITAWWRSQPTANVAITTAGLLVVDIDPAGLAWPDDEAHRAAIKAARPPLQRTPRGGFHLFFAVPAGKQWRCSAGLLAAGVDVRTTGGYVVAAPSTVGRATYQWIRPLVPRDALPPPPQWLADALDAIEHRRSALPPSGPHAPADAGGVLLAGGRNVGLASLAGRLRRAGLAEGEIAAALLTANRERCSPPLPDREVLAIARSIARYAPGAEEQSWAMQQAWRHAVEHRRKKLYGRKHYRV